MRIEWVLFYKEWNLKKKLETASESIEDEKWTETAK